MSAADIWHAQQQAVARGDWDAIARYFAPDCTWTLMPPGTTFRGPAEITGFMRSGFGAGTDRKEPEVRNDVATDDWGVFEYTSRGVIDAQRAAEFAKKLGLAGAGKPEPGDLAGRTYEVPICFVYHVNSGGQIDRVNEYAAAIPGLAAA